MNSHTSVAGASSGASKQTSLNPADAKAKPIRSSGRGGAGNIKHAVALDTAPVYALTLDHTPIVSGREIIPGSSNGKTKSNSGRGGSGNIRMKSKPSSKMAAIISEHEALIRYFERELIMASVTKRHETVGASGRGGVGNNYLKIKGRSASSSVTTLSATSSATPTEPPTRPTRLRSTSLGHIMLSKLHLRRKGKAPSLPVAFDDTASALHSPSGNEEIALPPAPPPTVRSLSNDGILSSVHTGNAAYTTGGGSSRYADDWSSFAESTWSFHATRARPPEAGSLAPLHVSSSFAATATAYMASVRSERTNERPPSTRSVGTFGVPKRKATGVDEGDNSPTFRTSTPDDDDDDDEEDVGRPAFLPSLAVDEEDEDISDDDHTHAFMYPPATSRPGWYHSQSSRAIDGRSSSAPAPAPVLPRIQDALSSAGPLRARMLVGDKHSIHTTSMHALARATRAVPRTRPVLSPLVVLGAPSTRVPFPSSPSPPQSQPGIQSHS